MLKVFLILFSSFVVMRQLAPKIYWNVLNSLELQWKLGKLAKSMVFCPSEICEIICSISRLRRRPGRLLRSLRVIEKAKWRDFRDIHAIEKVRINESDPRRYYASSTLSQSLISRVHFDSFWIDEVWRYPNICISAIFVSTRLVRH